MLPSVLAVLAVSALIASLAVWRGESPRTPAAHVAASAGSSTPASLAGASPSGSTPGPATPSESAAASTPTPAVTATPAAAAVTALRRTAAVVVLNQTARQGLASTVAATLRGKGWSVPGVGNFRGVVPATTVYYPVGMTDQARKAAADLPVTPRVRAAFGTLSQAHLTVVVTGSYPG